MDEKNPRLTESVRGSGCASKLGPGDLDQALCGLHFISDPNLIVGLEMLDDAGVYRLRDDLAIIQTIDYFTPIVDDPYTFGQIAAANALSDVYAMGGKPITAMNVVCFPSKTMDISVLRDIMRGGLDKLGEAGTTLLGGHSVDDVELKYGLSVTGIVHPQMVITSAGARVGDELILTKPVGTGIIGTALKAGMADDETIDEATRHMVTLNKDASELMQAVGVHACTDVTGFGLLGHLCKMIAHSDVGMELDSASVPLLPRAEEFARMGLVPEGTYRNRDFYLSMVDVAPGVSPWALDILFDPQTSGGLLISLPRERAEALLCELHQRGYAEAATIGKVVAEPGARIAVK